MFCVNCGKSLIRGYQFCIECGTPVTDMPDEENEDNAEAVGDMPAAQVEPVSEEGGSLVFCPNCGMHMQVSTAFCEMCGMRLSGEQESAPQQTVQPAVPLWNEDPLGGGLSGMSDSDIDRINNFVNGVSGFDVPDEETAEISADVQEDIGGAMDAGYSNFQPDYSALGGSGGFDAANIPNATPEEIDALTAQLAQYSASAGVIPSVSATQPQSVTSMQEEIGSGEGIRMQNFSMDAAEDEELSVTDGVPIISGGSRDEDPSDSVPINPYGFLDNDFSDFSASPVENKSQNAGSIAPTVESIMPSIDNIAPAVDNIEPIVESIVPSVDDIAPYSGAAQLFESNAPIYGDNMPTAYFTGADASAAAKTEKAPSAEKSVSEAFIGEESIYAQDNIIDEPIKETASAAENHIPPYAEVRANPFFEKNSDVSEPQVKESAALPEKSDPVQPDDDFADYGEPYIAEGLPVIAEYNGFEKKEPSLAAEVPVSGNISAQAEPSAPIEPTFEGAPELKRPEDSGRKITYCHNCGQDMYDDEQFCKNCSAPRNIALIPASQRKSKKLVPIIAAAAVVVVVVGAAATVFVLNGRNAGDATDSETLSVSNPVGNPVNSSSDPIDTSDVSSAATTENNGGSKAETEENIFPPAPVTSSDIDTETTAEKKPESAKPTASAPKSSAATPKVTSTPTAATTPKPAASTTPKPAPSSTSPKPATTPSTPATTPKPSVSSTISSAKVTSLEKDRKAITDAVAVIAGEVGKIEALAQNVVYAMGNSANGESARTAFYSRDFAKNMLSSIDSGKTAVDNAVSAASPKNSEFDGAYDNLLALQGKYEAYYKFIKSPTGNTSKFSSSCGTYLSGVTSYINSNFKYSSLTVSAYTSDDKSLAYKAILNDAVAAANSAISAFGSVEDSISALDSSNFDTAVVKELSKNSVSKNYANAAANAQKVAGYVLMLSGAPSEYSSAYNSLKSASGELTSLIDLLIMIQENTPDNYSESSSDGISAARFAVNKVKNAVS